MMNEELKLEIELAKELATEAHKSQTRWNGDPYITHPQRVSMNVSEESRAAAWLHDVIEDTPMTPEDLRDAGISEITIAAVQALTYDKENETYLAYILRVMENDIAREVKLADLSDNTRNLKRGSMKDKYQLSAHLLRHRIA